MKNKKINTSSRSFLFAMSLLFAVLLWVFVMADDSSIRLADIRNVGIELRDMSLLESNELIITSDTVLDCTVRVEGNSSEISNVSSDSFTSYVDLRNINAPGEYTLDVKTVSNNGAVAVRSTSPSTITVKVENKITKEVPLEAVFVGEADEDIYVSTPTLQSTTLDITGGQEQLEDVARGIVRVDLDSAIENYLSTGTSQFVSSLPVEFISESGSDSSYGHSDFVIVSFNILHKKQVEVSLDNVVVGVPLSGLRVTNMSVNPQNITIAGTKDVIDGITEVKLDELDITGRADSYNGEVNITPIENVQFVDSQTVNLEVSIGV